jgi:holliday junction DNA helicase RuvA
MIHAIEGTLCEIAPQSPIGAYVLLTWQGLTWQAIISQACVRQLPAVGQPCELFTSLVIREANTQLYGFAVRERRDLFNLLLSASGVGPKMAISLLDVLTVPDIVQAVASGHYKPLTTAKGVGPKLAQKMVLDLKDTMLKWRNLPANTGDLPDIPDSPAFTDAESVLLSLGYTPLEVANSFKTINPHEPQADVVLQLALRQLATTS